MAKFQPQTSNVYACAFTNPPVSGAIGNSYIQFENNAVLNLSGVNWTIEFWVKPDGIYTTANSFVVKRIPGSTYSFDLYLTTSGFPAYYNGTIFASSSRLITNTWNHVAYVFNNGANAQIYLNGTNIFTTASVTSVTEVDTALVIGANRGSVEGLYGKISNLRIIKGQAIYTGNFNITNYPFQLSNTSIGYHAGTANVAASLTGNVVLLTCNDATIKSNGNTTLNTSVSGLVTPYLVDPNELRNFSYFYPGNNNPSQVQNSTVLVTNSTNSLNLNTDFTIETWFYPTTNTGVLIERGLGGVGGNNASYIIVWDGQNNQLNFAGSNANGNTYSIGSLTGPTGNIGKPTINTWNHVAVTHTGTTYRGFLNGSLNMNITNNANVPYAALGRGVTIGGMFNAGQTYATGMPSNTISGYISNMRIIRGNSIYNAAFTVANATQFLNVTNTILLTGLTPAFEDVTGTETLAVNGMSEIQISTFSPFTANGVVNTIMANSRSIFSYTYGQRRTKVYSKLNTPYVPTSGVPLVARTIGVRRSKVNDRALVFAYQPLPTGTGAIQYQFWS